MENRVRKNKGERRSWAEIYRQKDGWAKEIRVNSSTKEKIWVRMRVGEWERKEGNSVENYTCGWCGEERKGIAHILWECKIVKGETEELGRLWEEKRRDGPRRTGREK